MGFLQNMLDRLRKPDIESISFSGIDAKAVGTKTAVEIDFEKGLSAKPLAELRGRANDLAAAAHDPKIEHGGFLNEAVGAKLSSSAYGTDKELFSGIQPERSGLARGLSHMAQSAREFKNEAAKHVAIARDGAVAQYQEIKATAREMASEVGDLATELKDAGMAKARQVNEATIDMVSTNPRQLDTLGDVRKQKVDLKSNSFGAETELFRGIIPDASLAERAAAGAGKLAVDGGRMAAVAAVAGVARIKQAAVDLGHAPQNLGVILEAATAAAPRAQVLQANWGEDPKARTAASQLLSSDTLTVHPGRNSGGFFSRVLGAVSKAASYIQEKMAAPAASQSAQPEAPIPRRASFTSM